VSRRTKRQSITALAFDKRGRLLSVGRNSYTKTHPVQMRYARKVGKPGAIYLHAEIAALIKARGEVYKLVVNRQGARGPLPACPCDICQGAIFDYGVKIVEHT
jgi:deoxycytidylate deaminase